jgi:hypothetical protein
MKCKCKCNVNIRHVILGHPSHSTPEPLVLIVLMTFCIRDLIKHSGSKENWIVKCTYCLYCLKSINIIIIIIITAVTKRNRNF